MYLFELGIQNRCLPKTAAKTDRTVFFQNYGRYSFQKTETELTSVFRTLLNIDNNLHLTTWRLQNQVRQQRHNICANLNLNKLLFF